MKFVCILARYTGVIFKIVKKTKPFSLDFHLRISRVWQAALYHICQQSLPKRIPQFPSNSRLEQAAVGSREVKAGNKYIKRAVKTEDVLSLPDATEAQRGAIVSNWSGIPTFHVSWIKLCVLKVSGDLKSAHLPSWVTHRPGGSYLWPSSAFISSSVDNGSSNPLSSLSVRGAGIFLGGPWENANKLSVPVCKWSLCCPCVWPQRIRVGKRPWNVTSPPQVPPRAAREPERKPGTSWWFSLAAEQRRVNGTLGPELTRINRLVFLCFHRADRSFSRSRSLWWV